MVGIKKSESERIENFLSQFGIININSDIAKTAVKIRQSHSLKLPDAIIWASAKSENALLVTRNSKDFPSSSPDVRIPYELS